MSLISVADALSAVLDKASPINRTERVPLAEAHGRVLCETIAATRDQPPFPASAMDGYAVLAGDTESGQTIHVIGESAAGAGFTGSVNPGECVRIFTGAPVPDGADAILIQENARTDGKDHIVATEPATQGRYIRRMGFDFARGEPLIDAERLIDPGIACLLATANVARPLVRARPRVVVLSTGNELVPVGSDMSRDQIVASSVHGVTAILAETGAEAIDGGIARDTIDDLGAALDRALDLEPDLVVTLGGASVGDHDLVLPVFAARGINMSFEKVAMQPGKPLMHGHDGTRPYLGLPGNPVSSLVCARLFGQPLVAKLAGRRHRHRWRKGVLGCDLPPNGDREQYMRASLSSESPLVATPFEQQDSSLVSRYAGADALVLRHPNAPAALQGESCNLILLRDWG